jgi:hypothetical protein
VQYHLDSTSTVVYFTYYMTVPWLRRLVAVFPPQRHGFEPWSGHVGLLMWQWSRFFPSTLVSPANLHSINCSTINFIHHLGLVQASSGRSTRWTLSHPTNNNNNNNNNNNSNNTCYIINRVTLKC